MEETIQTINAVASTLRTLFAKKDNLVGFDDWDKMIGCVMALERVSQDLQNVGEESKVVDNG